MKRPVTIVLLAAALLSASFASAEAGIGDILDTVRGRLGRSLLTYDVLAPPGKKITLKASLRSGLRLEGLEKKRLLFLKDKEVVGTATTDDLGDAAIEWAAPDEPGRTWFTVKVHPDDRADEKDERAGESRLLVAVHKTDAKIAVVDLDKTVVRSSFLMVLAGRAKPMPGAATVIDKLTKTHEIVYLTHRPDFLGPLSKTWLREKNFAVGPVLMSSLKELLAGSGTYKAERIEALKKTFPNIEIGIGDKISDARAYAVNGLTSILILPVDWSDDDPEEFEELAADVARLPDQVHVVTNWSQISGILFGEKVFPKGDMVQRLRNVARQIRRDDD